MICPNCNTMNPNSIKKCIKCGEKLEKSSGGAEIKTAASSGGPMLKQKEKPEKIEKAFKPIKVDGDQKKSSKTLLIVLVVVAAAALIFFFKDKFLSGTTTEAVDTLAVRDSVPDTLVSVPDTLKEDSIVLMYKGVKKARQDTTLYKSLSESEKAQASKKKKSFNDKIYWSIDGKKMNLIPGQTFIMGTDKGVAPIATTTKGKPNKKSPIKDIGSDLEKPAHSVKVKDFYLDETEVTNAQFKKFLDETKYKPKGSLSHFRDRRFNNDDMPVVDVEYDDAVAYATWAGKRLPTEREWECAAKDSQNYEYPTGSDMNESQARYGLNISEGSPKPVKSYRPNKFGIYDLAGNVSEWVQGVISQYPGNKTPNRNYGNARIPRGGSWMSPKEDCKTYRRAILDISKSTGNIGFRCAISKDEIIELKNK